VTSATFRNPGVLAVEVAQIDQMSGGRVELGIGAGWFEQEHKAYGIPFPPLGERFERFAEQLELITGLWTTPVGETYSSAASTTSLRLARAAQAGAVARGPPIIIGGAGKTKTPALTARYADEFNSAFQAWKRPPGSSGSYAQALAAAGRGEQEMTFSVAHTVVVGKDRSRREAAGRRDRARGR